MIPVPYRILVLFSIRFLMLYVLMFLNKAAGMIPDMFMSHRRYRCPFLL